MFPRRDLTPEEVEATGNGRPLSAAGIDGIYAASAADGRVIALLRDEGPRTKSVGGDPPRDDAGRDVVRRSGVIGSSPATMQDGTS